MRLVRLCTLFCALAGAATPSFGRAQGSADSRLTQYEFDDELVDGDDTSPNGEILQVRRRQPRESLVRARAQFLDRLLQSVESL
jgi:hypothetical protein